MTISDIYGSNRKQHIHKLFKEDLRKARSKNEAIAIALNYMPYIYLGRSANTIINKYTEMKQLCDELGRKGEWVKHIFEYPTKLIDTRNSKNQKTLIDRLSSKGEIDKDRYIKTYQEIKRILVENDFKIARNQKKDDIRAYYLSILIAMTTGRRITEILKTFSMSKHGKKLIFHGLLKKRGNIEDKEGFLILDEYVTVNKYILELREILDTKELTTREVGQKYTGKFNNFLKKIFPDLDISFKDLRSFYANIAWDNYDGNLDKDVFFQKILGHEISLSASKNYQTNFVKEK
jgi:hypothetical protein